MNSEELTEVEEDTGVVGRVGTGEGNARRVGAATTSNVDLVAGYVVLSTARGASNVQGNNLSTDEIVARGDVSGNPDVLLTAVGVKDISAPVVVPDETVLVDLEPGAARVGESIVDLGHVHDDGTVVVATNSLVGAVAVVGLSMHLNGDGATGYDLSVSPYMMEEGWLSRIVLTPNIADLGSVRPSVTATDIGAGSADGVVVRGDTSAGGSLVDTINPQLLEGRVGSSRGRKSDKSSKVELHIDGAV